MPAPYGEPREEMNIARTSRLIAAASERARDYSVLLNAVNYLERLSRTIFASSSNRPSSPERTLQREGYFQSRQKSNDGRNADIFTSA